MLNAVLEHYFISTFDNIEGGNAEDKFIANIKALQLLKELKLTGRTPSKNEQQVLACYRGWGGISQIFEYGWKDKQLWKVRQQELKDTLTEVEYKDAQSSVKTAFYTPVWLAKALWNAAEKLGFTGGRILEPSLGTGRFFGLMPEYLARKSQLTGAEIDTVSGMIAQKLYPKAKIAIAGFETLDLPDNYFDLAITNVPFGDFKVYDPIYKKFNLNIHNYFIVKAMDKVRPGGLGIFITSIGTMQSSTEGFTARKLLAERANLIAAYRLPEEAFESAGTKAAVDILILQKRPPMTPTNSIDFINLTNTSLCPRNSREPLQISEYYPKYNNHLLGNLAVESRWQRLTLTPDGRDVQTELNSLIKNLKPKYIPADKVEDHFDCSRLRQVTKRVRHGGYVLDDNDIVCSLVDGNAIPVEKDDNTLARIRGMIWIRDAARELLQAQWDDEQEDRLIFLRGRLNRIYDTFVQQYGALNLRQNKQAFTGDQHHGLLLALEEQGGKAAIFHQRTIHPFRRAEKADTAHEALIASLRELGKVDVSRIVELTGMSEEAAIKELKGRIYRDPVNLKWYTAEEYLAGTVKQKLFVAKKAAEDDPAFNENVQALEAVQPVDLTYDEIDARLGAPWIPAEDIANFAADLLGSDKAVIIHHFSKLGEWRVELKTLQLKDSVANTRTWGTFRKTALDLLEHALNQKVPEVRDLIYDTEKKREISVINQKETLVAQQQLERIKTEFRAWLWKDNERRNRLARLYNNQFNNYRLRTFDGSHLDFPGLAETIELRPHQKNAVWRVLQTRGAVLLDHVVGAGKTFEMQAAGMELRRLGLAQKPLYCIPNANFDDFINMFQLAYPLADLLVLKGEDLPDITPLRKKNESDIEYAERREVNRAKRLAALNRITTGDWDGVVMTHEIFRRIGVSPESQNDFINAQIDDLQTAILESETVNSPSTKRIVKSLESAKERLTYRLKRDLSEERRDLAIAFEDLGIDALFVDESDNFKNLAFATKMNRVAGVQNSGSQRAMDMYMKVSWLDSREKTVVFASGTPISNSISEMFTLMRYLAMRQLRERGIAHFDSWAANFGEVINSLERSPDGQNWRKVSRFANFINAPELITLYRSFADVQTAEDLDLPRPELATGERIIVSAKPCSELQYYIKTHIMNRVKAIKEGRVKPYEDNMLAVTSDMRKCSLDIRLVNPAATAAPHSKINLLVDNVARIWEDTKTKRSAQVIFCDLSIPKGKSDREDDMTEERSETGDLVVYDEIRRLLIKKGVAPQEIAFIHDAKNAVQKEKLKARVRSGEIRVLLASTAKGGVGVNIQKKLIALHHLDCPWRPRDIEQREGRILRQGNENPEVQIFVYVTEESADSWLWQTIKAKARFIAQAKSGKFTARTLADIEQTILSFAQIEALATGNPLIMEKVQVDADVEKYTLIKSKWQADYYSMQDAIAALPHKIGTVKADIEAYKKDTEIAAGIDNANFQILLNNTLYTNRKDADKALKELIEAYEGKMDAPRITTYPLGSYAGFALTLVIERGLFQTDSTLKIQKAKIYNTSQTIYSIEKTVINSPSALLNKHTMQLQQLEKQLADLKVQITRPFEYEEQLKSALIRQKEINADLGIGKDDDSSIDAA